MKLQNINEIAVSVIPTRTPVSKIHFSKEAAKSALGIVARDNLALAMDLASLRGIG